MGVAENARPSLFPLFSCIRYISLGGLTSTCPYLFPLSLYGWWGQMANPSQSPTSYHSKWHGLSNLISSAPASKPSFLSMVRSIHIKKQLSSEMVLFSLSIKNMTNLSLDQAAAAITFHIQCGFHTQWISYMILKWIQYSVFVLEIKWIHWQFINKVVWQKSHRRALHKPFNIWNGTVKWTD